MSDLRDSSSAVYLAECSAGRNLQIRHSSSRYLRQVTGLTLGREEMSSLTTVRLLA